MDVLLIEGLSKRFNDLLALDDLTFQIGRGEILGILGPNGAGKTTLINCILGLIRPTAGRITVFGLDLAKNRSSVLRRMNFASNYVSLPYSLTPFENLMVFANLYEIDDPSARCEEVLDIFGLSALKNKPARRLSSGQLMRLNLAKAMLNRPELLLLDEPTAGLDPEIAKKTREILIELVGTEGISVIYTSHNLKEMEEIARRVLLLNRGRVAADGMVEDRIREYETGTLEEFFFKVIGDED